MQIFVIRTHLLISKNIKGFLLTFLAQLNSRLQKRQEHISKGLLRGTKRIYKLDAISVLKFQNHLDIFVPAHQLSPI